MLNPIVKSRINAFHSQAGCCYYCGSKIWLNSKEEFALKYSISIKQAARFQCTAEHLIARCDGGKDKPNNIVAACIFCNQRRHMRNKPPTPLEYKKQIKKRLKKGKWLPKELHHLVCSSAQAGNRSNV